jgi:hypothetical protein
MFIFCLAGCGNDANSQTAQTDQSANSYSAGAYYNPNAQVAYLNKIVSTDSTTKSVVGVNTSPTPPAIDVNTGDTVNTGSVAGDVVVGGCISTSFPRITICFDESIWYGKLSAESVSAALPQIMSKVEQIVGPTGPVSILLINPDSTFNKSLAGNFQFEKRLLSLVSFNIAPLDNSTVAHELSHAAYQNAVGNLDFNNLWLNEAIAKLVEYEYTGSKYNPPSTTKFANTSPIFPPYSGNDYTRSERIGLVLKKYGNYPFGPKLINPDPVQTITGMSLSEFFKCFWIDNIQHAPEVSSDKTYIFHYGAVVLNEGYNSTKQLTKIDN